MVSNSKWAIVYNVITSEWCIVYAKPFKYQRHLALKRIEDPILTINEALKAIEILKNKGMFE